MKSLEHTACIRCGKIGETRRCHYNGLRQHMLGKGRGIKCNDLAVAEFCHDCDQRYSEASYNAWEGGSKSVERSEELLYFIIMTIIRNEGKISCK